MLSRFELAVAGRRPSLLGAAISQDNTLFTAHLTNLPLPALGEASIPQGLIHIACLPQAWSSGAVFMLLQSCLGVRIDGRRKEVHIERPLLPSGTESLSIRDLPVGDASIDLEFHRIGEEVVAVPGKHVEGGVRVLAHL